MDTSPVGGFEVPATRKRTFGISYIEDRSDPKQCRFGIFE